MSQSLARNLRYKLLGSRGFADRVLGDLTSSVADDTPEKEDRVGVLFKEYTKEVAEAIIEHRDAYPQEIFQRLVEEGFFKEHQLDLENQTRVEKE